MNHLRTFLGVTNEIKITASAFALGMLTGSLYDIFRALRKTFKHNSLAVAVEDVAFCIVFAFDYYCFSLSACDGALRGFALAAMLVGLFAYLNTLGIIVCDFAYLTFSAVAKTAKWGIGKLKDAIKFLKKDKKYAAKT